MSVALKVSQVAKAFSGIPVLKDISFSVIPGQISVLAGENGAGKSTLLKIVTGQLKADHGSVHVGDDLLTKPDPHLARKLGVGIVPQELAPYPDLSVYENIFVGREIRTRAGTLDHKAMIKAAREMLKVFDVDVDPKIGMSHLGVALTQIVEIAKATTWGAQVLLLDEPTSSIPEREVDRLHAVVLKLREQGVGMVYITHRMQEIQKLADRVLVLRDGLLVMDKPVAETTPDSIVHAMIGRELGSLFPQMQPPQEKTCLQVKGLQLSASGPQVSLSVKAGEILGIGGLVGAGRTEVLEAIYGTRDSTAGTVTIDDQKLQLNSPSAAIRSRVGIVPEDRKGAGLILCRSVLDNTSLPHLSYWAKFGWIKNRLRRKDVNEAITAVSLRSRGMDQLTGTLSGGNQQKVVLSRWLTREVKVLLLDEPTRGIDIGARGEIYAIIRDLAAKGMAILLVSSDMPELIGLSHRVLIMRGGAVQGELSREQLDQEDVQEQIFHLASGDEYVDIGDDQSATHHAAGVNSLTVTN